MPSVSIIVPMYNVEKYLARCLDSLLDQTCSDFEVICVDDCGPDSSATIARSYAKKYPNIFKVVFNPHNLGLGRTREHGISVATAPFVMFIDSDDYVANDYIETYLTEMQSNPVDVLIGGYTRDVDGKLTPHFVGNSHWSLLTYSISCAKMYKRDFLIGNDIHFSESRCGEDLFFSALLYCSNPSFNVIHYAGYHYYFNRESITSTASKSSNLEQFISPLFQEIRQTCNLTPKSGNSYHAIEFFYLANMLNALISYSRGCGVKQMKEKLSFFYSDAQHQFPNYLSNPYISFRKSKGQSLKIRIAVSIFMHLKRINFDWPLYYLISLI